ncbi:uracil-DNA glycosylase family protein [Alteriqipengyuania lutimaris]|uniref:Uracil-DNA glycosylase-like domain-containing protein n=1 Tax=Alteriqipengyuania lutimaris TaxID=1538146 RepID=A0A395LRM1_9SPHN|nr:hypothetical protein [Alteriqipengyuania lutimaris]MBB3032739.1 DNA polymerase [Alteriqipengyuania lutimaris]RDS78154.1 hypothetical protein DL238_11445 [Alteriqipengyuania lutimaris]
MADLSTQPAAIREAFLASLDWWREAGVEEHVSDTPSGWLKSREEAAPGPTAVEETAIAPAPAAEPVRKGALSRFLADADRASHPGDPGEWPESLEKFRTWWMESDQVDAPGAFPRVAPHGLSQAEAMLVIDQPQANDEGTLLGGPAGTLANNMLRAMGIAQDERYVASLLPRHTLRPDWKAVGEAGYGKLLLHHIALAAPKRLIVCGERIWSLLAHETAQDPGALTISAGEFGNVPAFAIPDLPTLLRNPAKRAQTWTRWLDWNESPR